MRWALALLLILFAALQWQLWGEYRELRTLRAQLAAESAQNEQLAERNRALAAEVEDLRAGLAAIEERARLEFGLIKDGETFYQVVEEPVQ